MTRSRLSSAIIGLCILSSLACATSLVEDSEQSRHATLPPRITTVVIERVSVPDLYFTFYLPNQNVILCDQSGGTFTLQRPIDSTEKYSFYLSQDPDKKVWFAQEMTNGLVRGALVMKIPSGSLDKLNIQGHLFHHVEMEQHDLFPVQDGSPLAGQVTSTLFLKLTYYPNLYDQCFVVSSAVSDTSN